MMRLIEHMIVIDRFTVSETQRVLVLRHGRFHAILGAGEHRLKRRGTERHVFDVQALRFVTPFEDALWRERPELAHAHLTRFETGASELAVIFRDGRPAEVLRPETRATFWTDAGPWTAETVDVGETLAVPAAMARRLQRLVRVPVTAVEVPEGHVGLMSVDAEAGGILRAGLHRFWDVGRKVAVKLVDTRWRTHDVTGQEILTRDRVTLRVNIAAAFRVTDPERAVATVKDFTEALHKALQLAFRKTLGALKLDAMLADKVTVDAEAAAAVRAEMAEIGIEVGEIALKDVILPGEMREILNQVVAVQKEAEANVIRRREETNATRSLLNTAKVMAENPVMLRLKELEALEAIAARSNG